MRIDGEELLDALQAPTAGAMLDRASEPVTDRAPAATGAPVVDDPRWAPA